MNTVSVCDTGSIQKISVALFSQSSHAESSPTKKHNAAFRNNLRFISYGVLGESHKQG